MSAGGWDGILASAEEATGPSEELDARVHEALGRVTTDRMGFWRAPPAYSGSVDVMLKLVAETDPGMEAEILSDALEDVGRRGWGPHTSWTAAFCLSLLATYARRRTVDG